MNNVFFFQIDQISDDSIIFDEFKRQTIFFSYFQVDQKYYIFFYAPKSIDIDFFYQSFEDMSSNVIQKLESKKRQIRSLRGFFLYALEIMESGIDLTVLKTNLKPFFWKKVKNIIRQNKKAALQEFLFGSDSGRGDSSQGSSPALDAKIQNLQNQVNSLAEQVERLQEKIIYLEMEGTGLNQINGSNFTHYDFQRQEYNLKNGPDFIPLRKISRKEKIEIIKTGFQRQDEGRISLKKYYEGTGESTLFNWKGFRIKYENIRRTKLYQNFKPKE